MSAKNKNVVATKEEQRQSENGLIDLKGIPELMHYFLHRKARARIFLRY